MSDSYIKDGAPVDLEKLRAAMETIRAHRELLANAHVDLQGTLGKKRELRVQGEAIWHVENVARAIKHVVVDGYRSPDSRE